MPRTTTISRSEQGAGALLRALLLAATALAPAGAAAQSFFGDAPPPASEAPAPPVATSPGPAPRVAPMPSAPVPAEQPPPSASPGASDAETRAQLLPLVQQQGAEFWRPAVSAAEAANVRPAQGADGQAGDLRALASQISRDEGAAMIGENAAWNATAAEIARGIRAEFDAAAEAVRRRGGDMNALNAAERQANLRVLGRPNPFTTDHRDGLFRISREHRQRAEQAASRGGPQELQAAVSEVYRVCASSLTGLSQAVLMGRPVAEAIRQVAVDANAAEERLRSRLAALEASKRPVDAAALREAWTQALGEWRRDLEGKRQEWRERMVAEGAAAARQLVVATPQADASR